MPDEHGEAAQPGGNRAGDAEIVVGFPGGAPPGPDPSADNSLSGNAAFVEKRRFVRVPIHMDLILAKGEERLTARLVDLSEGGMRCVVRPEEEFDPNDVVMARVHLGDEDLEFRGTISWEKMGDGSTEIGVQFVGMSELDSQQIRSHVFALQLRGRPARVKASPLGHLPVRRTQEAPRSRRSLEDPRGRSPRKRR